MRWTVWSSETLESKALIPNVMKPTQKIEEKRDQCLINQPLREGNLQYITWMNNSRMIEMKKPPFYIEESMGPQCNPSRPKNNKIKKQLFQLISLRIYLNFECEYSLDEKIIPHPRSTHVPYFWWVLLHEQLEIHEKRDCNHAFLCISHFSCCRTHRKYATWVLLGWGIKFRIQRVLPL